MAKKVEHLFSVQEKRFSLLSILFPSCQNGEIQSSPEVTLTFNYTLLASHVTHLLDLTECCDESLYLCFNYNSLRLKCRTIVLKCSMILDTDIFVTIFGRETWQARGSFSVLY